MEIFLFFAGFFLATYLLGKLLQKLRIPWIFSSLLLGLLLALHNPFSDITSSTTFDFLSQLGMLLLLFVIGFELDLKEISKSGAFVVRTTLALILAEAFVGSILVHYVFDVPWVVSIIVATSFATVGEAFILPILDEFKLTRTKLGQAILGVGVLDDIVELTAIIAATVLVDKTLRTPNSAVGYNLLILASIFLAAFMLGKARIVSSLFKTKDASASILLVFLVIFLFAGIGAIVDAAPLGALLAGLALQSVIPKSSVKFIDSDIKSVAYGIFAPTFFLSVGISADMNYILGFPLLIVLVTAMTMATKIGASYITGRRILGEKGSIIMGFGLSLKFSTSIVIIKLLFQKELIGPDLYSVLIGSTIVFMILVPILLSNIIKHWGVGSPEAQGMVQRQK